MKTKVFFDEEAREKLTNGMEIVYKAVSATLGSRGRNAAFTRWGRPLIANDGVSIARKINLEDPGENMGADYIKETAEKTNEEAGDGTTTATILAYTLVHEGFKLLDAHPEYTPMQLRKELEKALDISLKKLTEKSTRVEGSAELLKIATISAESEDIAKLVAQAVEEAGETGRVVVEESQGLRIEKENIEGMEIEGGYISPYFITNSEKQEAVLDNPYVLVSDKTFVLQSDVIPLMEDIARNGSNSLVIVCKDAQAEALTCMIQNKMNRKFNILAVKAPRDKEMLEDLSILCGRQHAYSEDRTVKKPTIDTCSRIRKVIASRGKTLFVKGDRTDQEVSLYNAQVSVLKKLISESRAEEKARYEDRLARLTGRVVIIKSGAQTSAEMSYLRLKIEDAVNAVKAAIKEGYVTGGGITLRHVCKETHAEVNNLGSELLAMAAENPVRILIRNAGATYEESKINETDGFDTDSGKYVKNLMSKGIIDPVMVSKKALQNSVSLAGMFLTISTLIVDVPEKQDSMV